MEILLTLAVGTLCIVCFFVGAKVGQTVVKGEDIKVEIPNPFEANREKHDKKEAKREQDRIDTIMRNIERYDGTSRGQEEVPRG